jgi:hypothetical protein
MDTIHGYMVVASGGSYSDKYHYNERFYLDRSEAVAYIESKQEAAREWNLFVALCPNRNRNDIIMNLRQLEFREKALVAWKIEVLKICEDNFPHFIERVKSLYCINKEEEETDLQIEEIEIPTGSRLYRLLNGAE